MTRLHPNSATDTYTFLDTCVLDDDHKALEEHLVSNTVQQSDLDGCLLSGLQIVQRKERELSHVAPALTLLLQSGAKWNGTALLDDQKTPLHIICESPGDHHELLDLMFKSSQSTIINTRDIDDHTALLYAVKNANLNCLKCLIANDADVTIGKEACREPRARRDITSLNPITAAIWMLSDDAEHSSVIMSDIFDLLLNTAVKKNKAHFRSGTDYVLCASLARNVTCMMKLIKIGTPLDIKAYMDRHVWELVASMGNVELLQCMLNCGIDKDTTNHDGLSVLGIVVGSGNIEAVCYLLELGVAMPTFTSRVRETQLGQRKVKRWFIDEDNKQHTNDPCMRAIRKEKLEIVKLLEEYESDSYKLFCALRCALRYRNLDVISYLLNKYTYPLNAEYFIKDFGKNLPTLLTDPHIFCTTQITKLLLDNGADPSKPMPGAMNAIMKAIDSGHVGIVAQYIRSGVDINLISWTSGFGYVSPLEASILHHYPYISEALLISGCSPRVNNHGIQRAYRKLSFSRCNLEKLKEWNSYNNTATPLQQRCRCVILNHLSPRADMKIKKLPLPTCLIQFLGIPELDNSANEN